eukprot:CAMPEP_0171640322 /NCGR_PEP_ID=MMETSP0990-20121206/30371_1 /TAXON_ID=483369 /ORGANISM="non described non described, Strain CCMP2098" /LENGTH=170 /DNA_ID=CAMNT_0012214491 /DNA_START=428 /DNA_END=941 /DNA_ORIENTATION=+
MAPLRFAPSKSQRSTMPLLKSAPSNLDPRMNPFESWASLKLTLDMSESLMMAPLMSNACALFPTIEHPRKSGMVSRAPFAWPIADDTKRQAPDLAAGGSLYLMPVSDMTSLAGAANEGAGSDTQAEVDTRKASSTDATFLRTSPSRGEASSQFAQGQGSGGLEGSGISTA